MQFQILSTEEKLWLTPLKPSGVLGTSRTKQCASILFADASIGTVDLDPMLQN